MPNNPSDIDDIRKYISTALLDHFGTEPAKINVVLTLPFLVIHLEDFTLSAENILLKQNESKRVMETRDLLLAESKPELIDGLTKVSGHLINELYADWNLEKRTGLLIAVMDQQTEDDEEDEEDGCPIDDETQKKLLATINNASKLTEKAPDHTRIHPLTPSMLLIERQGIMVDIEKELIKNGVINELRLAKRPLEHRLMESATLETVLNRQIRELFVDWDFHKDEAYMVLLLESPNK